MSDHEPDDQPPQQPRRRSQHESDQPDHLSGVDAVHIPAPRSPLDDQPDITVPPPQRPPQRTPHYRDDLLPGNGLVEPEFRYDKTWKRGKRRRYNGFVERVGGAEGERLREDLAAAVRDLLDWAAKDTEIRSTRDDNRDSNSSDGTGCGGGSDGEPGTGSGEDGDTR